MAKNKLAKWTELGTFDNVVQPEIGDVGGKGHRIKGNWKREIFRNENPVILELGCGKGEYTISLADMYPAKNYIGVDIKGARMWRGAKSANEKKLPNAAFLRTRIEFVNSFFDEDEIDEIWITFPDPHQGKRNSNKRLTCPWFLNVYRNFLKHNGIIHLKTDNTELYNYTRNLVLKNQLEVVYSTSDLYSESLSDKNLPSNSKSFQGSDTEVPDILSEEILSIKTFYENNFLKDGLKINYLSFRLDKEKTIRDVR